MVPLSTFTGQCIKISDSMDKRNHTNDIKNNKDEYKIAEVNCWSILNKFSNNSYLIESFKLSHYIVSFKIIYKRNEYSAYVIHYYQQNNKMFNDESINVILCNTPTSKMKTFTSLKSLKHLLSILSKHISYNDIPQILDKLEMKSVYGRIDLEIQYCSVYFQKINLFPHDTMLLIHGFINDIKLQKYVPNCICMLIKHYFVQYMHELVSDISYCAPLNLQDNNDFMHSVIKFPMRQNSSSTVYLFKFRITDMKQNLIGDVVDISLGVSRSPTTINKGFDNRDCYMFLDRCLNGDVIELIIQFIEECTLKLYLYRNNRRIGSKQIFDAISCYNYYPWVSLSNTNFSYQIMT
eukprot:473852_1